VSHLDSKLTHTDPNVLNAVAAYNIAIAHLINNPGDRVGAYETLKTFIDGLDDSPDLKEWVSDMEKGEIKDAG